MLPRAMVFVLASSYTLGLTTAHPHLHPTSALSADISQTPTSSAAGATKTANDKACMSGTVAYGCDLTTGGGIPSFLGDSRPTGLAHLLADINERSDTANLVSPHDNVDDSALVTRDDSYTMQYCDREIPKPWCTSLTGTIGFDQKDCVNIGSPITIFRFPPGVKCQVFFAANCGSSNLGFGNTLWVEYIEGNIDVQEDPRTSQRQYPFKSAQSFRCGHPKSLL